MMWLPFILIVNVDITTTRPNIDYRSYGQRAGTMTMTVNGHEFFEASPQTPVFVRIRLNKGARLAETLVDVETALWRNEPIFLAMSLLADDDSILRAPAHTVSIVRWKQGEIEFWLRVQTTSSFWLEDSGNLYPPDINHRIQWTIGRSIEADRAYNEPLFAMGKANLRNNVRSLIPVPTFLLLHTAFSILEPHPNVNSMMEFDAIGFDSQTSGVLTEEHSSGILFGDGVTANFSGDDILGFGIEGTPQTFMRPPSSLTPTLNVRNPTQEQQPVILRSDGETALVFVAEPGTNYFSLEGDWNQTSWVVEEEDLVTVQFGFRNHSGHVFSAAEAHLGSMQKYLVQAAEPGETTLQLCNPDTVNVLVGIDTVDTDGNSYQIVALELGPRERTEVPLDSYLSRDPVLASIKSLRPIYSSVVQHHDAGNGIGWIRPVPPLISTEPEIEF